MSDWSELRDRLQKRFDGSPLHAFYRFRISSLAPDEAELILPFLPEYDNGASTIHGGILSMLADTAVACALSTGYDGRMGFATASLNIHFLRRARTDVTALARIVKRGGTVCVGTVQITDTSGEEVAVATADFVLTTLRGHSADESSRSSAAIPSKN